jgi:MYXO-CTERM domain-containing protein
MKKFVKVLGIALLSSTLFISSPSMAQGGDNTSTTTSDTRHDNDDTGKWGLAGLLGLLGLLGLRKKDDDRSRITTTNR